MKKLVILFAQRVGALCHAILDERPKLSKELRSAAKGLVKTAERIIKALSKE